MKTLSNARYLVDMGCGLDIWRIHGINDEGKNVYPSTPIAFDEVTDTMTTASGSVYKILNYDDSFGKEKFVEQIRKDIANKGFESVK